MQIINTRPAQRAQALTLAIQQAGYQVVELPLLALEPLPLDTKLKNQYQDFDTTQYVVVVSPTAAELGLRYYFELGYTQAALLKKTWIAVGVATQQYLATFDIPSVVPDVETSEGMLSLSVFDQLDHTSIAFWRGIGGRTFMMECLKNQGCNILNMLLYKRHLPAVSLTRAALVQNNAIVMITSEESWNNWCLLGRKFNWDLARFAYIVLADRVTHILNQYFLKQQQNARITTVYTLKTSCILEQSKRILLNE